MSSSIIFRDRRLQGTIPWDNYKNMVEVDANTSLSVAFRFLKEKKQERGKKLKNLLVCCHGSSRGLQLGAEGLRSTNVVDWAKINGGVQNIVLYACAPAQSPQGRKLMQRLAFITNANVYASEDIQMYFVRGTDFGVWEGTVYRFAPSGRVEEQNGFTLGRLALSV